MDGTKAARIRKRTLVGVSLAALVALILWSTSGPSGDRVALAVGCLLACAALVELHRMGGPGRRALALGCLPAVAAMGIFLTFELDRGPAPIVGEAMPPFDPGDLWTLLGKTLLLGLATAITAFGLAPFVLRRPTDPRPIVWGPFAVVLWIALPLCSLGLVRAQFGTSGLVALLILTKIGDVVGYYVGTALGKSHPFPRLSPGKTTAGCVGSFVAGTVAGVLCQVTGLLPDASFGLLSGVLAGAGVNLAAQAGDLIESGVKRAAGVKDSGRLFGPSGGFLDLIDSLLPAVPVALVAWPLLFS